MNTHVGVATRAYPRHEMVLVIYLKADQLQPTGGSHNSEGLTRGPPLCTHVFRVGGRRIELIITHLFTNTTFVLLLFIKVAMLCSVDLLYYVCLIVLLKLLRWLKAAYTFRDGRILASTGLPNALTVVLLYTNNRCISVCGVVFMFRLGRVADCPSPYKLVGIHQ
jgi:hypothetical protein